MQLDFEKLVRKDEDLWFCRTDIGESESDVLLINKADGTAVGFV